MSNIIDSTGEFNIAISKGITSAGTKTNSTQQNTPSKNDISLCLSELAKRLKVASQIVAIKPKPTRGWKRLGSPNRPSNNTEITTINAVIQKTHLGKEA
jgi:hypothetical protein